MSGELIERWLTLLRTVCKRSYAWILLDHSHSFGLWDECLPLVNITYVPILLLFDSTVLSSKLEMPGSTRHDALGRQGELLKVFVVLDVCIDRLPDDFRSLRSVLFEPLTVFFFVTLRFLLLKGHIFQLYPKLAYTTEGGGREIPDRKHFCLSDERVNCLPVFVV